MSYHALRTHVFVFARAYHTLPTYVFGSVWLVWYITSCILHDNTRAPAYNSWPPVHVTYACKYTQGHPLRSQGPAQKRKDTRIEFVVLVHGGRRDVIRPAPHVDLYTHSRRLGMSNLLSRMHLLSPRLLASLYSEAWLPPFASLALLLKCMHARMSVCISQRPGQRRASLRSPSCSGPGARRNAAR